MTPAEAFDEAFSAALEDRRRLIAFLAGIGGAQARWKPPDGEWSILEGLEHVLLTDDFFRGAMVKLLRRAEETGRWDTAPARPQKMSLDALRRREQGAVPAPEALLPRGREDWAVMQKALLPSREATRRALLPWRETDLGRLVVPHPRYGDLNLYERIHYAGIHDHLHREQMERAARHAGFPARQGGQKT